MLIILLDEHNLKLGPLLIFSFYYVYLYRIYVIMRVYLLVIFNFLLILKNVYEESTNNYLLQLLEKYLTNIIILSSEKLIAPCDKLIFHDVTICLYFYFEYS